MGENEKLPGETMDERSEPSLYAYLSYIDPAAALDWLVAVGFEITTRQDGPDGIVTHAEARWGDIAVMIAAADAAYVIAPLRGVSSGSGLYLHLPEPADVDAWYGRAVHAGARRVIEPEDTAWGSRRARVLDPQGREWSAGTYRPGQSW
ncbi:VOC family protein [Streptomyces wedmorensis]|uniref:VOC family protein n=1 Tax=Streptomyces wedmorensis TaxID=43759 RepID=A0ABW6IQF6_STRWE